MRIESLKKLNTYNLKSELCMYLLCGIMDEIISYKMCAVKVAIQNCGITLKCIIYELTGWAPRGAAV
jgi:hypothetical protein